MKKTIDGNTAAASVAYALSDCAAIYPITPSSNMAELCDEWATAGIKNVFGNTLKIVEMQSEAGAIGAVHGSLLGGALTTTFTASQGLLLMIPNMYKIAGEFLPMVMHVSARALATHALSIFGDHSDVMACRQTGFNMLVSSNAQECMDMALVAHISALESSLPFIHFFDGFRTSHEISTIQDISYAEMASIFPFDKVASFRKRAMTPNNPCQQGLAQNPDVFFQNREACNTAYSKVYENVVKSMEKLEKLTGRHYAPFEYYGAKDAENVVIIMGSGAETTHHVVDELNAKGEKVGLVKVRLYRPFNAEALIDVLPSSVKTISVLDRTKEANALGEPLFVDVSVALSSRNIKLLRGRYGLGGKDFSPACVRAVFENMKSSNSKKVFTVGIVDDVTNLSLEILPEEENSDMFECKFYGLGSDGTVGANKNSIKILGNYTEKYVQGYFEYDSKKSGSITISHLRMSDKPIRICSNVVNANFIACHNQNFLSQYNILKGLKQNGLVLLNTERTGEELSKFLPKYFKETLVKKNARFFTIDASLEAQKAGLTGKINVVMQSAFFLITNIMPYEKCEKAMIEAVKKTYAKKGEAVIESNVKAIKAATKSLKEIDVSKLGNEDNRKITKNITNEFYEKIMKPIAVLEGNSLPVSSFVPSGVIESGTTKFEKRGIGEVVPKWIPENCIQCGMCVMACPHACIRPVLVKEENLKDKPQCFETKKAMGVDGCQYKIQVSPLDCTGCGVCKNVCPAKNKALEMVDTDSVFTTENMNYEYSVKLKKEKSPFPLTSPKGVQFAPPLFEFSGACAGCGETPYIKLATQLFGENMIVANATGCSSIYGGSFPSCPYTKNEDGFGPSWANSLFEDNAEFGFGMSVANEKRKQNLAVATKEALAEIENDELKKLLEKFVENQNSLLNGEVKILTELLEKEKSGKAKTLLIDKDLFVKKNVWIIGGDGWAYDIGFGGLDHVLASNQNVNILVLDTEVYSNTGGQSSKSTPKGSYAKFATAGKNTRKKDLAMIAVAHRNAYVAEISLGANMVQAISAMREAEAFDGPSLIIAYAPCINHGYNLTNSEDEMKKAVQSGYWQLFRFNPQSSPSLKIDSGEPTIPYAEFLKGENRFASILKQFPEEAKELFEEAEKEAKQRREFLLAISKLGEKI
ncbi:MAG: pyruvate:ferredoxin (flavodoxin) oxidoreductase [Clostridia bacterium]